MPIPLILRRTDSLISLRSSEDRRFMRRSIPEESKPKMMWLAANKSSMILLSMRSSLLQTGPFLRLLKRPSLSKGSSSPRSEPNQPCLSTLSERPSFWSMFWEQQMFLSDIPTTKTSSNTSRTSKIIIQQRLSRSSTSCRKSSPTLK